MKIQYGRTSVPSIEISVIFYSFYQVSAGGTTEKWILFFLYVAGATVQEEGFPSNQIHEVASDVTHVGASPNGGQPLYRG